MFVCGAIYKAPALAERVFATLGSQPIGWGLVFCVAKMWDKCVARSKIHKGKGKPLAVILIGSEVSTAHAVRNKAPALAEGVWGRVFCVSKKKIQS